jgi:hypothetical protein
MDRQKPNNPSPKGKPAEIDCFSCRHFFITHDRRFPYGCRKVGFKSKHLPSKEMYLNSNLECKVFEEKEKKR